VRTAPDLSGHLRYPYVTPTQKNEGIERQRVFDLTIPGEVLSLRLIGAADEIAKRGMACSTT
jgi:hypothetical protein